MTKKTKYKITEIINKMTPCEQDSLKQAVNLDLEKIINVKLSISEGCYKRGYSNIIYYDGYYLRKILYKKNCTLGNDAPRGGRAGEYIIVRNNKANREAIEFAKKYLELLED